MSCFSSPSVVAVPSMYPTSPPFRSVPRTRHPPTSRPRKDGVSASASYSATPKCCGHPEMHKKNPRNCCRVYFEQVEVVSAAAPSSAPGFRPPPSKFPQRHLRTVRTSPLVRLRSASGDRGGSIAGCTGSGSEVLAVTRPAHCPYISRRPP